MTADLTRLRSALAAVEAVEGPMAAGHAANVAVTVYPEGESSPAWNELFRALQGDLSAAVALVEREMPGATIQINKPPSVCNAMVWCVTHGFSRSGRTDTHLALALLSALARAKIAELEKVMPDKPEPSLDLIDAMGGEFLRHEDFNQGIRAAARVMFLLLDAEMNVYPTTPGSLVLDRVARENDLK